MKPQKSGEFDALLITRPENVRYLSGFSGEGVLLLKKNIKILITDTRYLLRAHAETKNDFRVTLINKNFKNTFRESLKTLKISRLGFEESHLTIANLKDFQKKARGLKIKFIPTVGIIETKRRIKKPSEIKSIKKSCLCASKIIKIIKQNLQEGVTEKEMVAKIINTAMSLGADDLAFSPVVAFGENSACPHAKPSTRKLKKNDTVLLDLGVVFDGYCSDITRTFFIGNTTEKQKAVYRAVLRAQTTIINKIKSGIKISSLDQLAKKILLEEEKKFDPSGKTKFKDSFTHALGHGVGLKIHEQPSLNETSKEKLRSGDVITIEPGVYLENEFGVRIEDTVLVETGGATILTNAPKKTALRGS